MLFHFHGRPLTMLAVAILVAVLAPAGAAKLRLSDLISPKELVHAVNATGLAWKYPPTHHHHHQRFSRVDWEDCGGPNAGVRIENIAVEPPFGQGNSEVDFQVRCRHVVIYSLT